NAVFWIFLLIFYFSILKYTYYYNYRSHIYLQVAKLAKSAGVQILIFPTVYSLFTVLFCQECLNSVTPPPPTPTPPHTHTNTHTHTPPHTPTPLSSNLCMHSSCHAS